MEVSGLHLTHAVAKIDANNLNMHMWYCNSSDNPKIIYRNNKIIKLYREKIDIIELIRSQTNNYDFEIITNDKLDHTAKKKNHYSNFLSLHVFRNIFEGLTSHIYRNS